MIVTEFHENQLTEKSAKNMRSWLITFNVTLGIVAVNFHQRWVFFAHFSVNSKSISMKFCKDSFQLDYSGAYPENFVKFE